MILDIFQELVGYLYIFFSKMFIFLAFSLIG